MSIWIDVQTKEDESKIEKEEDEVHNQVWTIFCQRYIIKYDDNNNNNNNNLYDNPWGAIIHLGKSGGD